MSADAEEIPFPKTRQHYLNGNIGGLLLMGTGLAAVNVAFGSDLVGLLTVCAIVVLVIFESVFLTQVVFTKKVGGSRRKRFERDVDGGTLRKILAHDYDNDPLKVKHSFVLWAVFGVLSLFIGLVIPRYLAPIGAIFKIFLLVNGGILAGCGVLGLVKNSERYSSKVRLSKETKFFTGHLRYILKPFPKDLRQYIKFQLKGQLTGNDVVVDKTKLVVKSPEWKKLGIESLLLQVNVTQYLNYPYIVLVYNTSNPDLVHTVRALHEVNLMTRYPIIFERSVNQGYHLLIVRFDLPSHSSSVPSISIYDYCTMIEAVLDRVIMPILTT